MRTSAHATLLLLLFGLLATACVFPVVGLVVSREALVVPQGESAALIVAANEPDCDDVPEGLPCIDVAGVELDFVVHGLPPGVTASFDDRLRSPSTPNVVEILIEVAADALPGLYDFQIQALADTRPVGSTLAQITVIATDTGVQTAPIAALATGYDHSLAALSDGSLRAWGNNLDGRLGVGMRPSVPSPVPVEVPGFVVDVAAAQHSLALTDTGTLFAWGTNYAGVLGLGDENPRFTPVQVPGFQDAIAVAAAFHRSLAVRADGTVWGWGRAFERTLGEGATSTPGRLSGLPPARDVAAGSFSLVLAEDGTVWSFGPNHEGQLGRDAGTYDPTPASVSGLPAVRAIAAGTEFALALDESGVVWSWGANDSGQLGDGVAGAPRETPAPVTGFDGRRITAIDAGITFALAVDETGELWGWGDSRTLGLPDEGSTAPARLSPSPVSLIAAGAGHSLALLPCGQLWGWGNNSSGALGPRNLGLFLDPTPIPGIGEETTDCDQVVLRVHKIGNGDGFVGLRTDRGLLCEGDCSLAKVVPNGTTAEVFARPGSGSSFAGWAQDCAGAAPETNVVMDRSRSCAARIVSGASAPSLLSVSVVDGQVTSSGGGLFGPDRIECGNTCQAVFRDGTSVELTAATDPGFGFTSWSGDCAGSELATTVTIDGPTFCSPRFRAFSLSVSTSGSGRVESEPAGIDCGDTCSFEPRAGSVSLTAVPELGWQLDGWEGDCAGSTPQTVVAMDADRTCGARFVRIPGTFILSVTTSGDGRVTSGPAGIDCANATCRAVFAAGSSVTLTAAAGAGSRLLRWLEDCSAPRSASIDVLMDGDKLCQAPFVQVDEPDRPVALFEWTAARVGRVVTFDASESFVFDSDTGGVDPDGITSVLWDFEDDGTVDAVGTRAEAIVANRVFQTPGIHRVRLTVRGGNSGPAGSIGEDSYVQEVSVGAAVETLRGLTVTKTGTGSGAIQSDPPGILRCDDTCTTVGPVLIEEGASVTLVATPSVGSSSSFGAWTGPCQGPLSSNVCPVTLDADRSVIGSFVGLAVTATAAPSRIDAGQSAQLSASVVGGTPPFSYDWLPASTLSAFDVANPTATPSNTTSYRVRVTDALGSFATSQVTVNVNLVVTATATPATIPFGGSSQLDVSIVGGSGPLTYSWSPAISLSDATRRNPVAAPLVSTQYNVVVTDGFGDVGVASVDVTVGNVGLSACITQVPIAPEAVRIDASCSLGNIVEYRYWADFRFEGQLPYEISTSPLSRILAYELSGTKLLRLEVRDTAGNISTATSLFVVP